MIISMPYAWLARFGASAIGGLPTILDCQPLCLRCRDQGVIAPADDASYDTCRGHLAEDRINERFRRYGL